MYLHILKFKKSFFIIGGILSLCFLIIFIFLFFRIKKIIVISQEPSLIGLNEIGDKNILFSDFNNQTGYFLNQNPNIKSIRFEKKYPDTVIIKTEERVSIARIFVGDKKIDIDRDGLIVTGHRKGLNEYLYPIYMTRNPVISGNSSDALVVKAIRYFEELEKFGQNLEKITLDDSTNSYTFITQSQITALVPFSEDPSVISSSLQLILTRFRIEGKRVTKVNFLFDKPVITLANE